MTSDRLRPANILLGEVPCATPGIFLCTRPTHTDELHVAHGTSGRVIDTWITATPHHTTNEGNTP